MVCPADSCSAETQAWNSQVLTFEEKPETGTIMQSILIVECQVTSVVSESLQPHGLYIARQAPLSMEFSRQGYWSGLVAISYSRGSSQPKNGNLSLLCLLHWQVDSLPLHHLGSPKMGRAGLN